MIFQQCHHERQRRAVLGTGSTDGEPTQRRHQLSTWREEIFALMVFCYLLYHQLVFGKCLICRLRRKKMFLSQISRVKQTINLTHVPKPQHPTKPIKAELKGRSVI